MLFILYIIINVTYNIVMQEIIMLNVNYIRTFHK